MAQQCIVTRVLLGPDERKQRLVDKLSKDYGYTPEEVARIVNIYRESLKAQPDGSRGLAKVEDLLNRIASVKELDEIESNENCYSALPLTPNDNRRFLEQEDQTFREAYSRLTERRKQELLEEHRAVKDCIRNAGLKTYDPAEAPFNPNMGLIGGPTDIYDVDQLMVAASRFFSMTNLLASSGAGMEEKTAIDLAKFPVILTKKGVYVSRMSTGPGKIILLEFGDIKTDAPEITSVFRELKNYEPGAGICERHRNTLLGFRNRSTEPICLKGLIEDQMAPNLRYDFDQFKK